ncbi:hypothetical protein PYW07_001545 [Mythimna separata]|uniref:Helicase C-terminal domain-containing protein n=1 Tax=Mythimna separata TaxID=271217 RepID=A0AAD7YTC9_MYTSE|nr:hypothetical protein PYW07_001545 [Mythimna separata]
MCVMRNFREGLCNVLVATCVAEEGLDVGSVDLIICFDISTKSPVRLVQRCGRTGRERGGQVFILVTEGREHQTLVECMRQRDGLNRKVLQSQEVENNLYKLNPRMIPHDFTPECQKMFITVEKKQDPKEKNKEGIDKAKKNQKDLRTMLLSRASTSGSGSTNREVESGNMITEKEFKELFPEGYCDTTLFAKPKEYWTMNREKINDLATSEETGLKLSKWLEWQRSLQKTVNIHHSRDSEILAELLQFSDAKRFELPPSTQNPCFGSQELNSQPSVFSPAKLKQPSMFMSPAKSNQPAIFMSPVKSTQSTMFLSPAKSKQPLASMSPGKSKQPNKKKQKVPLKPFDKKDGDIRALFSTATKSTKSYTKLINDLGLQNDGSVPTRLISLLVDLSLDNTNTPKNCYICQNICECTLLQSIKEERKVSTVLLESIKAPKLPDISLIDDFDAETILKCVKKSDEAKHNVSIDDFHSEIDFLSTDVKDENKYNTSMAWDKFDIGDIADIFADDSGPEEAIESEVKDKCMETCDDVAIKRKNIVKEEPVDIINQSLGSRIIFDEDLIFSDNGPEEAIGQESVDEVRKRDKMVNDELKERVKVEPAEVKESLSSKIIFTDDLTEIQSTAKDKPMHKTNIGEDEEPKTAKETLGFFGLDSIDDIFADDEIENTPPEQTQMATIKNNPQNDKINKSPSVEYPVSPSLISGRIIPFPTSPILCSQRKFQLSTKKDRHRNSTPNISCRKQLIKESTNNNHLAGGSSIKPETSTRNSIVDTSNETSMTITQLVDMINRTDGNGSVMKSVSDRVQPEKERSVSPILLTQADRKKSTVKSKDKSIASTSQNTIKDSLIILDSDSDSDSTQIYDPTDFDKIVGNKNKSLNETDINVLGGKRKRDLDESIVTASPYFNKKPKLDNEIDKQKSLQAVLAAMKKNKNMSVKNDKTVLNCVVSQPSFSSQKENKNPQILENGNKDDDTDKKDILDMLQMFRRDSKLEVDRSKFNGVFKSLTQSPLCENKRKLAFDDSDDDFVSDERNGHTSHIEHKQNDNTYRSTTNHKVRKKKKKVNEFLDMEAELSDEGASGDELSDDSVGSIIDFICDDDNVTHHEDIQAVYLKSIKSPLKGGGFKIPELPARFNKQEILSQYVEEDSYEMDSFCVDSHIGLTQVHEVSELELAEMKLEQERKAKKKFRRICTQDDSPDVAVIKRNKPKRRLIDSDSDEDST